jgi:hypothetical protein
VEPLLEVLTLPLAYHVLLLTLALGTAYREYAAAAVGVVFIHVLGASMLGGQPLRTLLALAAAPFYILWKITTLDGVFSASRKEADWVRTGRDGEVFPKLVK